MWYKQNLGTAMDVIIYHSKMWANSILKASLEMQDSKAGLCWTLDWLAHILYIFLCLSFSIYKTRWLTVFALEILRFTELYMYSI